MTTVEALIDLANSQITNEFSRQKNVTARRMYFVTAGFLTVKVWATDERAAINMVHGGTDAVEIIEFESIVNAA